MWRQALCIISYSLVNSNWSYSLETPHLGQNRLFFVAVWPWNLTDDLKKQKGISFMLLQALCIISYPLVNSNWSYSLETPNLGQIWCFFKNNRAPLLSINKPYAWFLHHMWIQTGVTVRKLLSWVVTSVTLTFDFWPWPFAWTSLM